jgi:hypothetical protein
MECPQPATLSGGQPEEIRKREEKLGVNLVACEKVHPSKKLSSQDLTRIQTMEKDTGSILIAYEA